MRPRARPASSPRPHAPRAASARLAGELVIGPGPEVSLRFSRCRIAPHRAVQKAAVVADDEHRMRILREIAFQPERAFEIEIVGRLVEQQQVGLGEQHRRPAPPASASRRRNPNRAALRLGIEAEPLEDGRGPALGRPGVDIGQPVLDLGDAVRVGRGLGLGHQARRARYRPQARCRAARSPTTAPPAPPRRSSPATAARSRRPRAPARPGSAGRAWSCRCRCGRRGRPCGRSGIVAEAPSNRGRPSTE